MLIKIGLKNIPALTFAGLRYFIAFLLLLAFMKIKGNPRLFIRFNRNVLTNLILLGILYYAVTQGTQFVGLFYLPAVHVSLFLNFTPLFVLLLSSSTLSEKPTFLQVVGIITFLIGVLIYFFPLNFLNSSMIGNIVVFISVITNALSSILGRKVNRSREFEPIVVTTVSMGIGSTLLLVSGISFQGLPALSITDWLIIFWLAAVNTAFAFTLWNKTLQVLQAAESSIINGTMLIQIAILAWIFLGEALTLQEIIAIIIVSIGVVLVQIRLNNFKRVNNSTSRKIIPLLFKGINRENR